MNPHADDPAGVSPTHAERPTPDSRRSAFARIVAAAVVVWLLCGVVALLADTQRDRIGTSTVPLPVDPVPPERFGVATGSALWGANSDEVDSTAEAVRALGAHWLRAAVRWDGVEPDRSGVTDWSRADALVAAARRHGLRLLVTVSGAPAWSRPAGTLPAAFAREPAEYGRFVGALARRYRGRVAAYELGNEPNHTKAFPVPGAARYAEFLRAGSLAVRAADSDALVLTGGIGGLSDDDGDIPGPEFVADLLEAGAADWIDAISYHPYSYPWLPSEDPGARGWSAMLEVHAMLEARGLGDLPVWITEFGAPTGGPTPRRRVSEEQQAAILRDGVRLAAGYEWAGPLFWFTYRDRGDDPSAQSDHFGLYRSDGRPKPAASEYRLLADGAAQP